MGPESEYTYVLYDQKEAFRPLRGLFKQYYFNHGIQFIPYLPSNFGPRYVAKIEKKLRAEDEDTSDVKIDFPDVGNEANVQPENK